MSISSIAEQIAATLTEGREYQFTALLGDLQHKLDVYTAFGDFHPEISIIFENKYQAEYLKQEYPQLVPKPAANGLPPSDHRIATAFEFYYQRVASFRAKYLTTLYTQLAEQRANNKKKESDKEKPNKEESDKVGDKGEQS